MAIQKIFFSRKWVNFNPPWHRVSLVDGDSSLFKWGAHYFPRGDYYEFRKYINVFKKSSSPESLGHFQLNFAQSILGCSEFSFVQMKGSGLSPMEIITKLLKYIDEKKKISRTTGLISSKLSTNHHWMKGLQVFLIKCPSFF